MFTQRSFRFLPALATVAALSTSLTPAPASAQFGKWLDKATEVLNKGEKVAQFLNAERVLQLSSESAYNEMIDAKGAVPMPDCVAHVKARLEKVLGRSIRLTVIQDSSFNASAYPNGAMFIHTGTIEALGGNEDAIAAVLGHEIAHVEKKHSLSRFRSELAKDLALETAFRDGNAAAIGLFLDGVLMKYSRDHEGEADRMGFIYAVRAGYSPDGAAQCMEKMAQLGNQRPSDFEKLFSSHPPTGDRVQRTREYADLYRAGVSLQRIEERKVPKDKEVRTGGSQQLVSSAALDVQVNRAADTFRSDLFPRFTVQAKKAGHLMVLFRNPEGVIGNIMVDPSQVEPGVTRLLVAEGNDPTQNPLAPLWKKKGSYEFFFVLTEQPLPPASWSGSRMTVEELRKQLAAQAGTAIEVSTATLMIRK